MLEILTQPLFPLFFAPTDALSIFVFFFHSKDVFVQVKLEIFSTAETLGWVNKMTNLLLLINCNESIYFDVCNTFQSIFSFTILNNNLFKAEFEIGSDNQSFFHGNQIKSMKKEMILFFQSKMNHIQQNDLHLRRSHKYIEFSMEFLKIRMPNFCMQSRWFLKFFFFFLKKTTGLKLHFRSEFNLFKHKWAKFDTGK